MANGKRRMADGYFSIRGDRDLWANLYPYEHIEKECKAILGMLMKLIKARSEL